MQRDEPRTCRFTGMKEIPALGIYPILDERRDGRFPDLPIVTIRLTFPACPKARQCHIEAKAPGIQLRAQRRI